MIWKIIFLRANISFSHNCSKHISELSYFTSKNITKKDFANLGPNHNVLAQYFDYTHENIILRYNAKECIMYMNMILKDLLHR